MVYILGLGGVATQGTQELKDTETLQKRPVLTARRLRKHRLLRCKKCETGPYPSRACEAHVVLLPCSRSAIQSAERPDNIPCMPDPSSWLPPKIETLGPESQPS